MERDLRLNAAKDGAEVHAAVTAEDSGLSSSTSSSSSSSSPQQKPSHHHDQQLGSNAHNKLPISTDSNSQHSNRSTSIPPSAGTGRSSSGSATSQNPTPPAATAMTQSNVNSQLRQFRQLDKNNDGVIDRDEWAGRTGGDSFAIMDVNGDGVIDREVSNPYFVFVVILFFFLFFFPKF